MAEQISGGSPFAISYNDPVYLASLSDAEFIELLPTVLSTKFVSQALVNSECSRRSINRADHPAPDREETSFFST